MSSYLVVCLIYLLALILLFYLFYVFIFHECGPSSDAVFRLI